MSSLYTRVGHGRRGGAHGAQPVVEALCGVGRHSRRLVHVTAPQREMAGRKDGRNRKLMRMGSLSEETVLS